MFEKILVPLDGTSVSEDILLTVSLLAKKCQSRLLLLSVIDSRALDPREGSDEFGAWETHIKESMQTIVERLEKEGLEVNALVIQGIPQEEIVRTAEREACDLIALLSHGRNLFGWALLGSVAYHVLHLSSVPVFMLTPKKAQEFPEISKKTPPQIVVALDGTQTAEKSLSYAEQLSRTFESPLSLVQVVSLTRPPLPAPLAKLFERRDRNISEKAKKYLDGVEADLESRGLSVERHLLEGSAVPLLVRFLTDLPNTITVLCTRTNDAYVPYVLGSTSLALLGSSGGPFLLIPHARELWRL